MPTATRRILVVEDEPTVREPVLAFLTHWGYQAEGAENGIEALDCIKSRMYDLLIMDIKMPYLDGQKLSRVLQEESIRVPILVITALDGHEVFPQEAGRLIKTFAMKQLQAEVERIFRSLEEGAK
jgi:DNA-binding response OmpR family regulator